MSKLLELGGLLGLLTAKIHNGTPTFGTCAGMILLASGVKGTRPDAHCLSALDITAVSYTHLTLPTSDLV